MRNSPMTLRLARVEQWRKLRYERLCDQVRTNVDMARAMHAADLYTEAARRGDYLTLASVGGARSQHR
jgi:hypothetical protein